MSSAKKYRQSAASCLHESRGLPVFFDRAKARERDGAKRNRAPHCGVEHYKAESSTALRSGVLRSEIEPCGAEHYKAESSTALPSPLPPQNRVKYRPAEQQKTIFYPPPLPPSSRKENKDR